MVPPLTLFCLHSVGRKPWMDIDSAINLYSHFKKAKGHNVHITPPKLAVVTATLKDWELEKIKR